MSGLLKLLENRNAHYHGGNNRRVVQYSNGRLGKEAFNFYLLDTCQLLKLCQSLINDIQKETQKHLKCFDNALNQTRDSHEKAKDTSLFCNDGSVIADVLRGQIDLVTYDVTPVSDPESQNHVPYNTCCIDHGSLEGKTYIILTDIFLEPGYHAGNYPLENFIQIILHRYGTVPCIACFINASGKDDYLGIPILSLEKYPLSYSIGDLQKEHPFGDITPIVNLTKDWNLLMNQK